MAYPSGSHLTNSKQHFRVTILIGTRPEAIKMAPIISTLKQAPEYTTEILLSGQHSSMCKEALWSFGLSPDAQLVRTISDYSLAGQMSRFLRLIAEHLSTQPTDLLLVHGDTTTGLAGAMAAFYSQVPVGHVEAGLRSRDMVHPFPEEANRRLTDPICNLLFAPTEGARRNLLQEKIDSRKITVTGNTVVDAVQYLAGRLPPLNSMMRFQPICAKGYRILLVTAHRRENWGDAMTNICHALLDLVHKFDDIAIILPLHPNPNVQKVVKPLLSNHPRIFIEPPFQYKTLITVMREAHIILTDSGGIQEEAPSFGTPVLVLRNVTERPEAVIAGTARLIGTKRETIVAEASKLLTCPDAYRKMISSHNPFGDGRAAERIHQCIDQWRRDHHCPAPQDNRRNSRPPGLARKGADTPQS
jgi:UDP-N-acetylglucosamine 2-epimerase (non-hydrolysing)